MAGLAFLALSFGAVFLQSATASGDSCPVCEDVHFFLARGNNEPYPGRQGQLVAATCKDLSSCGYEDLIYSALYTDEYCQTAYDGSVAGLVQIPKYAQQCPHSKLILAGYSQGGQIAADILGGGCGTSFNGCLQPDTPPLDSAIVDRISAVIIFGETRHNADQSYNYGNGSSFDGWFPRDSTQLSNLAIYSDRMRNWCVSTDPICAVNSGLSVEADHLSYYDVDSEEAASWIKSVASLTDDSSFTTTIATSISGTAQDYATIGTATPSGAVVPNTAWTVSTSYSACTAASSLSASNSTSKSITSSPTSGSASGTSKANSTSNPSVTSTKAASASASLSSNAAKALNGLPPVMWTATLLVISIVSVL